MNVDQVNEALLAGNLNAPGLFPRLEALAGAPAVFRFDFGLGELPEATVANTLASLDAVPAGATTSLQRDIADGKPSELEAWTGAAVRLGRAAGVATPTHYADPRLRLRQPAAGQKAGARRGRDLAGC